MPEKPTLTERLAAALSLYEMLDEKRANCEECTGEDSAEMCPTCFPFADNARVAMRQILEEYRTIVASLKHDIIDLFKVGPDEATSKVLVEIAAERERQDAKFGEQNLPLVLEIADGVTAPTLVAEVYGIPTAFAARDACDNAHRDGRCTWGHIIVEEKAEFIEAAALGHTSFARAELVQLAAVAVAAVECIDRAAAKESEVA